jgi:CubicO group peptidase (beta-lactamase class C family)
MKMMNKTFSRMLGTIEVPRDLAGITTGDSAGEADPADADMNRADVDAVWSGVEDLYRTGIYPGISFCLQRHGRIVLNRAIGHSRGNGPGDADDDEKIPMTPETPVCQYSASKAVTAMLIHLLVERGEIHLADPIAHYIPEFAAHGKQNITIYQMMSHHGGIPTPTPAETDPDILFDHDRFIDLVCGLKPSSAGGRRMAYHAVTGGAILGEIVRRVTGNDIRTFLAENIAKPLGFRYFSYGVSEKDVLRVAKNYATGPPLVYPVSRLVRRALNVSWRDAVRISNDPRFLSAIIPAANLVATAGEMSRFFQLLLNDGELDGVRIFKPLTVRRALVPSDVMKFDGTMIIPMKYSPGMMLGASPIGLWGPYSERAFGHVGFINIFCWADPDRHIAVSLQTTGKCLISTHLIALARLLLIIGRRCRIQGRAGQTKHSPFIVARMLDTMLRRLLLGE